MDQQFTSGGQSIGASVSLLKSKGPGELSSQMTRKGGTRWGGGGGYWPGPQGTGRVGKAG